jgi:CubicO group peptidase (beta-lactamase class C family)
MDKKKKLFLMRIAAAIVTISSIYIFAPWREGLYYFSPLPDTVQEEIDQVLAQGLDGVIVYVDTKGKEPELYASGWHDRDAKIPAYPSALFKIASIAKLYDASAIAKLAASELLSLDKTLADYMPELADRIQYAEQITLRMMVQHRSGIPNFTDQPEFKWGESSLNVLDFVYDKPADFEPGTDYAYSNTNYLLLQQIMERLLGYPYGQYIHTEMLAPLGISNTYFSVKEVNQDDLMSGYYQGYPADFKHLDQGMVATAEDVGKFLRALNDGSLFSEQEAKIYSSLYEYSHDGWVLGYMSKAHYHPDIDTVVIQFINTTGGDTLVLNDALYSRVVDIISRRK